MRSQGQVLLFEAALIGWCLFEIRRRKISEAAVRLVVEDLEDRVRDRTTALTRANDLKDRFLATVSHELRTPLNAILGWVHLLRAGRLDHAGAARAIESIERNVIVQTRLINDLLDVSNMMKGRLTLTLKPLPLRDVVQSAVQTARVSAENKGVTLECAFEDGPLDVMADGGRLEHALSRLLGNAIKFTPRGGRVIIELGRVGRGAELRVIDTGVGIARSDLPHVFERFVQGAKGSREGLGLGLAFAKEIVQLHRGDASAHSDGPGTGTTVRVWLPLIAEPAQQRGQKAHHE